MLERSAEAQKALSEGLLRNWNAVKVCLLSRVAEMPEFRTACKKRRLDAEIIIINFVEQLFIKYPELTADMILDKVTRASLIELGLGGPNIDNLGMIDLQMVEMAIQDVRRAILRAEHKTKHVFTHATLRQNI